MLSFILRRVGACLLVLFGATFIVYVAASVSVDPYYDLRQTTSPNKPALMAQRAQVLDLNTPVVLRYFKWLGKALTGNLGIDYHSQQPVRSILASALPSSLQLIFASLVIAVLLGVAVGITSAIRQYSGFDYSVTFLAFLFYSLPIFWVAVLLKEFGAIKFNDFLVDPVISWPWIFVISLVIGLIAVGITGFKVWKKRFISFGIGFVLTFGTLAFISLTHWFKHPGLGIVVIGVTSLAAGVGITALMTGIQNRRALGTAASVALIGVVLYYPLQYVLVNATIWLILGLLVVAIGVGIATGIAWGGDDRGVSARIGALTAFVSALLIFADRIMQVWEPYVNSGAVAQGRPVPTIGAVTPNLTGGFWVTTLDTLLHVVLPTIALILITFASYTRYSRSSLLEVMNQDYIRTARSKGLPERVVILRHAFRNALIPLATVIPIDIAAIFGGAIITEKVFSWSGMGAMFLKGMQQADINIVMGYFLVTAIMYLIATFSTDLIYAGLDPRIRVSA